MNNISPIPYVYDSTNTKQAAILNQIKGYCQIPQGQQDAVTWNYIWQAIRRISLVTCWENGNNDTFIEQTRKQIYYSKTKNKCCRGCCNCDGDVVRIPLEYFPMSSNNYISGKITVVINGKPVEQQITTTYLKEHTDWETGILYINREDFPEVLYYRGECICLCKRELSVELVYNAGFTTIPNGLLPVMCKIIASVDTDTSDSCATNMTEVSGLLKRKKLGNIEYEWDTNDNSVYNVSKLTSDLNALGVLGEIMSFSRCAIAEPELEIGGVV